MVCGPSPGGFKFTWEDIDPHGTQRLLKKGNLALHVEKNKKHLEHVEAVADKTSGNAGGSKRFLSYFQMASASSLLPLTLPLLLVVV